jgi:uncharacterized damage-inducible protein DinB
MPPPVTDERDALRQFLALNQRAFFAVAYGLTDAQARSTPTASTLSIGGLIKHVTSVQQSWTERVTAAPDFPPADPRPMAEQMADRAGQFVMREDETLEGVLTALDAQNTAALRVFAEADLDAPVPVPHQVPWFPKDIDNWSVRWVGLHVVEELTRHAGHADIIRESIDGATMYELIAGLEGSPETDWLTPWKPA